MEYETNDRLVGSMDTGGKCGPCPDPPLDVCPCHSLKRLKTYLHNIHTSKRESKTVIHYYSIGKMGLA